jgi:hypothetical protein
VLKTRSGGVLNNELPLRARQDVHGYFHFLGGEVVAVGVRHVLVWLEAVVGAEGLRLRVDLVIRYAGCSRCPRVQHQSIRNRLDWGKRLAALLQAACQLLDDPASGLAFRGPLHDNLLRWIPVSLETAYPSVNGSTQALCDVAHSQHAMKRLELRSSLWSSLT